MAEMFSNLTNLVLRTLLGGLLLTGSPLLAQRVPTPAGSATASAPAASVWSLPSCRFVTSLCVDQQGNLWTGTEDEGIWCSPADGSKPRQYMPKDGLGDEHCYALACDTQGRIWAGHQSHGVSVFNGQEWQNYEAVGGLSRPDSLNGPLGERIFDIAVCPTDGDVWMATSLGLSRYRTQAGQWQYYTRMEGLPSDQIQAIAFDSKGTIYAGTQCDGLAIAKGPNYAKWQVIQGPDQLPLVPGGRGLPTNLINDVLVTKGGTIWVATSAGLAWSNDKGKSFRFIRGADWAGKVKGLLGGAPGGWSADQPGFTLLEDYCTTLLVDAEGYLWIGHRQRPYERIDVKADRRLYPSAHDELGLKEKRPEQYDCLQAFLELPEHVAIARYGGGLDLERVRSSPRASNTPANPPGEPARLPVPAAAGHWMPFASLFANGTRLRAGSVVYLGDDWQTKGDWVSRYGRHDAILCAASSPGDDEILSDHGFNVKKTVGPNARTPEAVRCWIHWKNTDDPRVLYDPCIGHRRQADWDDHGETYPMTQDGPDLLAAVTVPAGVHRAALYFFNKDGHGGANRYRDYLVEVSQLPAVGWNASSPVLAKARVRDFWGGQYKQFALVGPGRFVITIKRNYSLNATISGIFLQKVLAPPDPLDGRPMVYLGGVAYDAPAVATEDRGRAPDLFKLWDRLQTNAQMRQVMLGERAVRLLCLRRACEAKLDADTLSSMRWRVPVMSPDDRAAFVKKMSEAWREHRKLNGVPDEDTTWPEGSK
jgi:hypothetical protein